MKVKVGAGGRPSAARAPRSRSPQPEARGRPGLRDLSPTGDVVNRTGDRQARLLLYAVARKGGEVVAAGRGAIEPLKPEPKAALYNDLSSSATRAAPS